MCDYLDTEGFISATNKGSQDEPDVTRQSFNA